MKPEHDRILWEDVEVTASEMFHVWLGDGEIKWVEECWKHLGEANLTDNSPALERTTPTPNVPLSAPMTLPAKHSAA